MNSNKSAKKEIKINKQEWITLLYSEAWKQYVHEDNLGQTRTNFFISIQTAIIAIIGFISPSLYNLGTVNNLNFKLNLGLIALGGLWIIGSSFAIFILTKWAVVTKAGKEYVRFRRIQLMGLEKIAGIDNIGISTQEIEWLDKKSTYFPFKAIESIKSISVKEIKPDSGWISIENAILCLRLIWTIILIIGIFITILGIMSFNS